MPEAVLHWHYGFVFEVAGTRLVADFRCIQEADRSLILTAHSPHRSLRILGMPSFHDNIPMANKRSLLIVGMGAGEGVVTSTD